MWSIDARVPVRLGSLSDVSEGDAVLVEGGGAAPAGVAATRFDLAAPGHAAQCACCVVRGPAALALAGLFQARAKRKVAFFRRVVALTGSAEGRRSVEDALRDDPLVSARFRRD